jgi:transcription elongation factor Elf1
MTQDEIIEMYGECVWHESALLRLEAFAKLVAAKAIAELESQEPMALPCCGYTDASAVKWNPLNGVVQCHNCGQTYTTSQRTWVGLTDEEHCDIWYKESLDWMEYGKAIEAKLKERNDHSI